MVNVIRSAKFGIQAKAFMRAVSFTFCFYFIFFFSAVAQDNTPKYSNEFLHIGVDARAFGLAGCMTAHTSDVSSGFWNPAGLTDLEPDYQLDLMHSAYFGGLANYDFGAFAMKTEDKATLGLSLIRFAVDDIADTRLLFDANGAVNYDNIKYFSAADYGVLLSYARKIKKFGGWNVGGNAKIIRRVVGNFAGSWGFGVDFGIQRKYRDWGFGLVARDVFGTFNSWSINDQELASTYAKTGNTLYTNSLEITLPRLIAGISKKTDFNKKLSLLTTAELMMTTDGKRNTLLRTGLVSFDPAAGVEFGYKDKAFVRGGVNQFQQMKDFDGSQTWAFQPNIGVGFKIQELAINYAFTDIGDQAAALYSHVFSITVDFDAK